MKAGHCGPAPPYNGVMTITITAPRTGGSEPGGYDSDHPCDVPGTTVPLGALRHRDRAAVHGTVVSVMQTHWVGGPVLEVEIDDGTGTLLLAFFGRPHISGVAVGRSLTAAGAVGRRDGHLVALNPALWIDPFR